MPKRDGYVGEMAYFLECVKTGQEADARHRRGRGGRACRSSRRKSEASKRASRFGVMTVELTRTKSNPAASACHSSNQRSHRNAVPLTKPHGPRRDWRRLSFAASQRGPCRTPLPSRGHRPAGRRDAAPNTLTEQEKQAGFKLLFDGKTTDQFRSYKKDTISHGLEGHGRRADHAPRRRRRTSSPRTSTRAFELLIDYKISTGGNSGIMFHVTETDGPP